MTTVLFKDGRVEDGRMEGWKNGRMEDGREESEPGFSGKTGKTG